MIAQFQRLLSAGILFAWGGALCGLYLSGRIASYLIPTFQPFTLVCGAALIVLSGLVLIAPRQSGEAGCSPAPAPLRKLLGTAILLAPLALALVASKDEFGATTVRNRNYVTNVTQLPAAASPDVLPGEDPKAASATEAQPAPKPAAPAGPQKAEVIDLLYAAQLPEMRSDFENLQIEMIGQLMPAKEDNPHGDRYDVVRMFMTCCAADVQPIAVPVHPDKKTNLPEMTWVKVTGKATFPVVGGERRPLVENAVIEKTTPPDDTYLY